MGLVTGEAWTEEKIESFQEGRAFDALVETAVMGRRVKMAKQAVAWDDGNKPIMHGPQDYLLEDYDPEKDGAVHPLAGTRAVFPYSVDDRGIARVADWVAGGKGVRSVEIRWAAEAAAWRCRIVWTEEGRTEKSCESVNAKARMAVYRAALKAVLL